MAEEQDEQVCRICFQGAKPGDIFLAPCKCSGSQRWVHHSCLEQWQWSVLDGPNNSRAVRCGICDEFFDCGLLDGPMKVVNTLIKRQRWKAYLPGVAGFLAVCCGLVAAVLGSFMADPASEAHGLRPGCLLISTNEIRHGIFFQSVILMVEHSRWGALGLIVNKPIPPRELDPPSIVDGMGGPVERHGHIAYLYANATRTPTNIPAGLRLVLEGVWWQRITGTRQLPEEVDLGDVIPRKRLYGYAGWAPNQLETEIARRAWRILNASQELVFDPEPATVWNRLTSLLEKDGWGQSAEGRKCGYILSRLRGKVEDHFQKKGLEYKLGTRIGRVLIASVGKRRPASLFEVAEDGLDIKVLSTASKQEFEFTEGQIEQIVREVKDEIKL